MPDHVHLFIEFDPRKSLHRVIKALKGKSSNILRKEFPKLKSKILSLWTRSYFVCSVGHINDKVVKKIYRITERCINEKQDSIVCSSI